MEAASENPRGRRLRFAGPPLRWGVCRRAAHFIVQGCNIHAWLSVQGRIKELAALRFQVAQCDIAQLGISERRTKFRAATIATLRAGRKLHPGAWGFSDGTRKTQIARPLCCFQVVQSDCAAQLGERLPVTSLETEPVSARQVCCNLKPRSELPVGPNLGERGNTKKNGHRPCGHKASHSCAIKRAAGDTYAGDRRSRGAQHLYREQFCARSEGQNAKNLQRRKSCPPDGTRTFGPVTFSNDASIYFTRLCDIDAPRK
jgi:hypothetical protein